MTARRRLFGGSVLTLGLAGALGGAGLAAIYFAGFGAGVPIAA